MCFPTPKKLKIACLKQNLPFWKLDVFIHPKIVVFSPSVSFVQAPTTFNRTLPHEFCNKVFTELGAKNSK